jgi:hypothetical protein
MATWNGDVASLPTYWLHTHIAPGETPPSCPWQATTIHIPRAELESGRSLCTADSVAAAVTANVRRRTEWQIDSTADLDRLLHHMKALKHMVDAGHPLALIAECSVDSDVLKGRSRSAAHAQWCSRAYTVVHSALAPEQAGVWWMGGVAKVQALSDGWATPVRVNAESAAVYVLTLQAARVLLSHMVPLRRMLWSYMAVLRQHGLLTGFVWHPHVVNQCSAPLRPPCRVSLRREVQAMVIGGLVTLFVLIVGMLLVQALWKHKFGRLLRPASDATAAAGTQQTNKAVHCVGDNT